MFNRIVLKVAIVSLISTFNFIDNSFAEELGTKNFLDDIRSKQEAERMQRQKEIDDAKRAADAKMGGDLLNIIRKEKPESYIPLIDIQLIPNPIPPKDLITEIPKGEFENEYSPKLTAKQLEELEARKKEREAFLNLISEVDQRKIDKFITNQYGPQVNSDSITTKSKLPPLLEFEGDYTNEPSISGTSGK